MSRKHGRKAAPQFGRHQRKQIVRGDIVASFQYIPMLDEHNVPTGEREPGVIIMRVADVPKANRGERAPKVVIGLSAAWKYGIDSYAIERAQRYAQFLFGDATPFTIHRIHDFLNDMLIELCTMKPEPIARERAELAIAPDGSFRLEVEEAPADAEDA